jgi:hypothetical protein
MNILLQNSQVVQICPICQNHLLDDFSSKGLCIHCHNMISYTILYDLAEQDTVWKRILK